MIEFKFNKSSMSIDELWSLSCNAFQMRFPESHIVFSNDLICHVSIDSICVFEKPLALIGFTFKNDALVEISIKWNYAQTLSLKQRKSISHTTIELINKNLKCKSMKIVSFFGSRKWLTRDYILTYELYEHFTWEEVIIIKCKRKKR